MPRNAAQTPRGARLLCVGLVLATVLALSACTGIFPRSSYGQLSSNSGSGITIASLRPKHTDALKPYYAQTVSWTTCHRSYLCATVLAPVDWQHVTSASITLALIKHSATGTSRGDLVVNPGGPGASGSRRGGVRAQRYRHRRACATRTRVRSLGNSALGIVQARSAARQLFTYEALIRQW